MWQRCLILSSLFKQSIHYEIISRNRASDAFAIIHYNLSVDVETHILTDLGWMWQRSFNLRCCLF